MVDEFMTIKLYEAKRGETISTLKDVRKDIATLTLAQADTSKHLFHDNGGKSMQSVQNEQGVVLAGMMRGLWVVYGILATTLIGGAAAGVIAIARHMSGVVF